MTKPTQDDREAAAEAMGIVRLPDGSWYVENSLNEAALAEAFMRHRLASQPEALEDRDEPGAIRARVRKGREQSTLEFVQEWLMSGDHEPDRWHKDFAAAIDARAGVRRNDQEGKPND